MHRAVRVKPLQNYLILVSFDDGADKVYNCYSLLEDKLFSRLRDVAFFRTVHIDEMGLVCWDDSTDLEPHELYENSESVEAFAIQKAFLKTAGKIEIDEVAVSELRARSMI